MGAAPAVSFSSETARGFTWHEQDEELGLVNMKGRIYDPKVGRFLTPDPVVSNPMFGQSWNGYSYVLNNPLAYVDPSGFDEQNVPHAVIGFDPNGSEGLGLFLTYTTPDPRQEAQDRANTEAMLTATSPVPIDVGTIGTTVGFVPQGSPTALEQSTATQVTSANDDGDPSWVQHRVTQVVGGYVGGLALGYVPIVGPAVSLGARWAIGPGTRPAQIGKAVGEIVGGFLLGIGGVGLILTGGGAPAGVAAIAGSVGLVAAGLSIGVGAWELNQALMSKGSGGGAAGGSDYSHIPDPKNVAVSTKPTPRQVREMKAANRAQNGGELRSDLSGKPMVDSAKSQSGVTPPVNEAQVDHINPIDKGGTRAQSNLQLITREENRAKWNQ